MDSQSNYTNLLLSFKVLNCCLVVLRFYTSYHNCTNLGAVHVGTGSKEGQIIREEALKLFSNGLERKLISVLEDLLSSTHPEQMVCAVFARVFYWAPRVIVIDWELYDRYISRACEFMMLDQ